MQTNGNSTWGARIEGIWAASSIFFSSDNVMIEQACEPENTCDTDQLSFKAYFTGWLAATAILAPSYYDKIVPYLTATATAAAQQCDGGASGTSCGFKWTDGATYDGTTGVGQQMSALGAIHSSIVSLEAVAGPVTNSTGGTSVGNAGAGTSTSGTTSLDAEANAPVTTGDRVGAGFLTFAVIGGVLGGSLFMSLET